MRKQERGPLPRRGFMALGGMAALCAACEGARQEASPLRAEAVSARGGGGAPEAGEAAQGRSPGDYLPGATRYLYRPRFGTPQRAFANPLPGFQGVQFPAIEVIYAEAGPHALPHGLRAPPRPDAEDYVLAFPPVLLRPPDSATHPAHVQFIARCAEFALWRFLALGFRPAALGRNGAAGDGTLRIVLADTQGFRGLTSPEWDHVEVSNRLIGVQALMTVGHEIFHRVQYAYNGTERARRTIEDTGFDLWLLVFEGGARFAEDLLVDGQNRYAFDAARWFTARRRPLARSTGDDGGLSGASYEAALFWKYVAEQHGEGLAPELDLNQPARPPGLSFRELPRHQQRVLENWLPRPQVVMEAKNHLEVLKAIALPGDVTVRHLREARARMQGVGTFDRAVPVRVGGSKDGGLLIPDTTWTNFACGVALNGQSGDDRRFEFVEQQAFRGAAARVAEISGGRTIGYDTLPLDEPGNAGLNLDGGQVAFTRDLLADARVERLGDSIRRWVLGQRPLPDLPPMLRPFDIVMFKVVMPGGPTTHLLRVEWDPSGRLTPDETGTMPGGFVQVVMLGPGGHLVDAHRHDAAAAPDGGRLRRTFACRNVEHVLILVSSTERDGNFHLALSRRERLPVLFATGWNCPAGRSLTHDPAAFEWTWTSPDLDVVTEFSPQGQGQAPRQVAKVRLAVQNIGDLDGESQSGSVRFAYRPWRYGSTGDWIDIEPSRPIGRLLSVERYEREIRGGRESDRTRMLGKVFVEVPLPPEALREGPVMLKATITDQTRHRADQPLVVLGSSAPISRSQIRITDPNSGAWMLADPPGPAARRPDTPRPDTPRAGTMFRSLPGFRSTVVPFRIDR